MIRIFIWLVMMVGGAGLGFYLDLSLFPDVHGCILFHMISFILGALLLKTVMTISRNTGRVLAKYGRKGKLPRMETNRLVSEGPYKYMRHPMHLGLLFFPAAFALIVGSPSFILIIAPAEAFFMLLMIALVEEPGAKKKFGKEYDKYKKDKPWFCLKKECLKELFKYVEKI